MSRPLILAAAAAVLALAAALLLSKRDTPAGGPEGRAPAGPGRESGPDPTLSPLGGGERGALASGTTTWSVAVVDEQGLPLPDSRVVAVGPGGRREATGGAAWSPVEPGTWTLVVSAEGRPVWRRDVEVREREENRTVVQLTRGVRITGIVRDQAGRTGAGRIVAFVPGGGRAPEVPSRWLELPHTRTRDDGRFTMLLPEPGEWRLFVGWGGEVAVEEPAPTRLEPGGPSFAEVTVPAPTRLVVEVRDAPGVDAPVPHGVSVYRDAARIAEERAARPRPLRPPGPDALADELDDDARAESEAEAAHLAEVEERMKDPEEQRRRALRMAVVPEGWAKEKSGICGANGRIVFERLPVAEELRFAVARGTDAFAVDGAAYIGPGEEVLVRIEVPPPLPADAPLPDAPRRVLAEVLLTSASRDLPPSGVSWR